LQDLIQISSNLFCSSLNIFQIVGVGDTGIDWDNCYFADPNVAVPFNTVNKNHRKIVMYKVYGDQTDHVGGHGTHVVQFSHELNDSS
jgi:hypothetical protein